MITEKNRQLLSQGLSYWGISPQQLGFSSVDQISQIPGLAEEIIATTTGAGFILTPQFDSAWEAYSYDGNDAGKYALSQAVKNVVSNPKDFVQKFFDREAFLYGYHQRNFPGNTSFLEQQKQNVSDAAKWLLSNNVLSSEDIKNEFSSKYSTGFGRSSSAVHNEASSPFLDTVLAVSIAFVAPQIGASIAVELGVSAAVGTAIASAALQTAAGVPFDKALENSVVNAVVQTGSASVAKDINAAMTNLPPDTAASISNAAGSALASAAKTAVAGGSTQDIINNAIAGAAGSAVASETGSTTFGGAVTGGLTGGVTGALMGAATSLGKEQALEAQDAAAQAATARETAPLELPTASETGGIPPVSGTPAEGTAAAGVTPTAPAPQEIPIPDQITQVQEGGALPPVIVTGGYEPDLTTTEMMNLISDQKQGAATPPVPAEIPVLPEVTVTASPYEPELTTTETPATITDAEKTEEPATAATTEVAPEPYKPQFFVAGGVSPRMQARAPSSALAEALQTPFYGALPTTGLTSYRGAGEIESSETGGKRRNVWNEASLRLKDALGI